MSKKIQMLKITTKKCDKKQVFMVNIVINIILPSR